MYKSIQQFCESGIINLDNICAGFFEDPENIAGFVNGVHYEQLEGGKDPSSEESGSDREQHRRTHQPCTGEQDELKATWLVQDRSRPDGETASILLEQRGYAGTGQIPEAGAAGRRKGKENIPVRDTAKLQQAANQNLKVLLNLRIATTAAVSRWRSENSDHLKG